MIRLVAGLLITGKMSRRRYSSSPSNITHGRNEARRNLPVPKKRQSDEHAHAHERLSGVLPVVVVGTAAAAHDG